MKDKIKISVVIPVYNEEKYIVRCLESIENNTVAPYEIIVADGHSEDKTRALAKKFSGVRVLDNPGRTAACGRNVGIKAAGGNIIAFTDGDCYTDKNWIGSIERAFLENDVDGIGGKVVASEAENEYEAFWNKLAWSILMSFGDEQYIVRDRTMNDAFITANCAYKKTLLKKLRGFDLWFGNNAEDIDLSWRALASGAKLMYCPEPIIYAHGVTSLKDIKQKSFRNGISSSKLQKRYGGRINFDKNIYKMWAHEFPNLFKSDPMKKLAINELTWHLLGKYYGSIKYHVFNI